MADDEFIKSVFADHSADLISLEERLHAVTEACKYSTLEKDALINRIGELEAINDNLLSELLELKTALRKLVKDRC